MSSPANVETQLHPRRIAFLDHTARLGGGEIALLNLVRAIDRARFRPIVLLFSHGPLVEKLRHAGVETHVLPLSDRITNVRKDTLGAGALLRLRDVGLAIQFVWQLARWIRVNRIDLVHCNSLKSDLLGGISALFAGRPCIWHVRDRISEDYLPRSVARTFRALCRLVPSAVIVNSRATHRVLGTLRASVVHDGTNIGPLPMQAPEAPSSGARVGLIGRITWWKGQEVFIRAAAIVRQKFPDAKFLIVGSALFDEAEYDRAIRSLVSELQLEKTVDFTGFREDIRAVLSELDLVVHASTTGEPFGQVVIEAMAAAKAVVATNGGGIPEIVTPECGLLVPMKDHRALAAAIEQLLGDPQRRIEMGRRGRERVAQSFLIAHTAAKIEKVFDAVLSRHP